MDEIPTPNGVWTTTQACECPGRIVQAVIERGRLHPIGAQIECPCGADWTYIGTGPR